ncbi:MAG: hypothetical protein V7707_19955 [Motiliproteus sp.]
MIQAPATTQLLYQFELELTPLYDLIQPYHPLPSRTYLTYRWKQAFLEGQILRLSIPAITDDTSADTRVISCSDNYQGYQLMLAFTDEEQAFRFRMVEQLCHIHQYQRQLQYQGRRLSINEAAGEWISCFAGQFISATATI